MILLATLLLTNCAQKSYTIKSEKGKVVNKVPAWYMAYIAEKKACDKNTSYLKH